MIALNDYFKRIGYSGKPAPDLKTLQDLHWLHPASIPFENVDVLLDRGINIELEAIGAKLLTAGRGGYCFEHNNLMMHVLRTIGFAVEPLLARVVWHQPEDAPPGPQTHMVLRVDIEGQSWLVDVGFGGLVLTTPLQFILNETQTTQHESFRLVEWPCGYRLEALLGQQWFPVYELNRMASLPIDFEVANWYTATHPDSRFRSNLMVARTTDDTRYTLLNNRLSVRQRDAALVQRELDAAGVVNALSDYFLLPVEDCWQAMLEEKIIT